MAVLTGLMAFTRGYGIRALSITGPRGLFTAHAVGRNRSFSYVSLGNYVNVEGEEYWELLMALSSVIGRVMDLTGTRYYTFLGRYVYIGSKFTYEPYVDLLKTVTLEVTRKRVRIKYGDNTVNLRRTKKGYTPAKMLDTLGVIVRYVHEGWSGR
ncbi:hypothetical protein [Vulcanisaeta thermophila]|uniref:hypothetical protein n=1 Tax=Vulcanisaeta thermophila TaxID=867917 RepID=UPI000852FCFC|nr:hypothetical protein [Vulcanisaeta thermophila]